MCEKDIEEVCERVAEDDLVILPGMYWAEFRGSLDVGCCAGFFGVHRECPWMEFEVVVQDVCFLSSFVDEIDADLNFEFAPSASRFRLEC